MNHLVSGAVAARPLVAWGLCVVLAAGLPLPSEAARPLLTDDARVVDPGSCQVESWLVHQKGTGEAWSLPACSLGLRTEWAVGLRRRFGHEAVEVQGVVQVKRVLVDSEPGAWGAAFTVGSQGIGSDPRAYINLPVTRVGSREEWLVHLNLGLLQGDNARGAARVWGWAGERLVARDLWLMAERHSPQPGQWQTQAGLRWWWVPGRLQVDATSGLQRDGPQSQRFFTLGLRWIFTPSSQAIPTMKKDQPMAPPLRSTQGSP